MPILLVMGAGLTELPQDGNDQPTQLIRHSIKSPTALKE